MTDPRAIDESLLEYYAARATEYDDWYLRRGRYAHGEPADTDWATELDQAMAWLNGLPVHREIVELAAGTGWWSPLLAAKGELCIYDANDAPLTIASQRLRDRGLSAHIQVRDAWAEPDREVDGLFMGFWLSHVPRARLGAFLAVCRRWLKPGGLLVFIDSRLDSDSSATNHPTPKDDLSVRRLNDGREFTIPKIYYQPDDLVAELLRAGFAEARVEQTPRFFLLGQAIAADGSG